MRIILSAISHWQKHPVPLDLTVRSFLKLGRANQTGSPAKFSRTSQYATDIFNIVQVFAWAWIALDLMPEAGHFLYDEAYYYFESLQLARGKLFPAMGPFISGTEPTAFTPGAGLYILYAPAFLFSSHPAAAVVWLIILSATSLLILDRVLRHCGAEPVFRFLVITLGTWSFWHFKMSDRMWNVNLYWFTNLSLLSVALTAAHRNRLSLLQSIIFGVLAGFAMQIHIGGALAVALCGIILIRYCFKSLLQQSWYMAGAFACMYLPYLIYDGMNGFANTKLLTNTIPHDSFSRSAVSESLKAVGVYGSHLDNIKDLRNFPGSNFFEGITFYICLFLTLLGLMTNHLFRMMMLTIAVILPTYFILNHRNYLALYAAPLIPYAVILPALGLTVLYKSCRPGRVMAVAYAAFFAASGYYLTMGHFSRNHGNTIEDWLKRTRPLVEGSHFLPVREKHPDNFIFWALASVYFETELSFRHSASGQLCTVTFKKPADENPLIFDRDHPSFYKCSSPEKHKAPTAKATTQL